MPCSSYSAVLTSVQPFHNVKLFNLHLLNTVLVGFSYTLSTSEWNPIVIYTTCVRIFTKGRWDQHEVRKKYLSSANDEDKKQQVSYQNTSLRFTCLHWACIYGAPDDIVKSLIDIGGKKLVMVAVNGWLKRTELHYACIYGASFNIVKMLIDVGGKDLVMAKTFWWLYRIAPLMPRSSKTWQARRQNQSQPQSCRYREDPPSKKRFRGKTFWTRN